MIDLYSAGTPNGWKISIALEELGLEWTFHPINLSGGQYAPEFLAISPNNRIPAIVDQDPGPGRKPMSLFESAAILQYLSEKTGKLLPKDPDARWTAIAWLAWQVAGLGPMLGQNGHFKLYAAEKIPYAMERYQNEAERLYRVLDGQLGRTGAFLAGEDYSIADIACFPWIITHKAQGFTLDDYPNIKRWFTEIRGRDAVQRGISLGGGKPTGGPPRDEKAREILYGIKPKVATQGE
ncbi:MAG: glutathione S-transferase N-terminal domain-containing protein [Phenylobacterium sp.]|uniref:glutathione S-transferase N-terminal domain-containing protein n=1 Tax=Phenylobacterium sp. TaxID=1871053 RepID=UPI002735911B|nr:glutathione S-transferase N-terminal domain-containing protein [Phenylobacterium sp.]MDP3173392.1 glutathione S-transferase N-terminal domain-containing protein [Phenylobacterium sp.]